jgi:uncharacterized protein YjbI with pentapeptide repeats
MGRAVLKPFDAEGNDAQMTGADLHDPIMPRAAFTGAPMTGANLAGAFWVC